MIIITGTILYFMNSSLFIIVLIATLINIFLIYIFKKPYKNINLIQMEQSAKLNSSIIESLKGIETVKSNSLEKDTLEKIENNFIDLIKTGFKEGILSNTQQSISSLIGAIINIVMLWIGASLVMRQNITIGALMTFISMASFFMNPIGRLIGLQLQIQESQISMKRLTEIYDIIPEKNDNKLNLKEIDGNIEFKDVSFRYGTRKKVLKDTTFEIKKGKSVAIVGKSGSGKSTIAKLILGLYEIEAGQIKIGNNNVNEINFNFLRNKIAYVNQNIELFSGSIRENFKLVNFNVDNEKINNVIKISDSNFIYELPNGLDTFLEEAGANLSGGERQKIAIARSLIKDFDILIFDEATSNLDFVSEQKIYLNLIKSSFDKTMIFIAHRLSTIKNVDCIYVLEDGIIVEEGTHEILLNMKGKYFELWNSQNIKEEKIRIKKIIEKEKNIEKEVITYE